MNYLRAIILTFSLLATSNLVAMGGLYSKEINPEIVESFDFMFRKFYYLTNSTGDAEKKFKLLFELIDEIQKRITVVKAGIPNHEFLDYNSFNLKKEIDETSETSTLLIFEESVLHGNSEIYHYLNNHYAIDIELMNYYFKGIELPISDSLYNLQVTTTLEEYKLLLKAIRNELHEVAKKHTDIASIENHFLINFLNYPQVYGIKVPGEELLEEIEGQASFCELSFKK